MIRFFFLFFFLYSNIIQAQPLKIVASFSILADIVKEITGAYGHVSSLVGPNGDAHIYQPTPTDVKILGQSDLVFVNGFHLEGWIDRLIENSGYKGKKIIVTQGITPLMIKKSGNADIPDPHCWHSIKHVKIYAENIYKALIEKDKKNEQGYKKQFDVFIKKLITLEEWIKGEFKKIPGYKRIIITAHDAFEYFGKEYGLQLYAPMGVSTEAEPTPKDLCRIISMIRQNHIKALFAETTTDKKIIRQIAKETNINVGGELYSDALSDLKGPASTYLKMMRHNVSVLLHALK